MRFPSLNIVVFWAFLLVISAGDLVQGGKVVRAATELYKRYLKSQSLPFEDCGSQYDILYLSISSCTKIPCEMKRGSTVLVHVIFDDDGQNVTFLKNYVRWVFNAVKTEATISPDPCDGIHECIINNSDGKSYTAEVYVNDSLPVLGGSMIWMAENSKSVNVICFKVPVIISL